MKLNFQQDVLVLPASVLSSSADADAAALRVLLWLASDLSLAERSRHKQLAKLADCDQKSLKAILKYWKMYGVLTEEEEAVPVMAEAEEAPSQASAEKPPKKALLQRADELPSYTSTELAELMESRATVRALVDEAQQILGKMFNPSEVNILIGMFDYLGMSEECILLLLAHCKRIGKANLRAIEKYAYSLVDKGITDSEMLEEEIRRIEEMHSFEGELRTLFGMKARALTSKEKKMFAAWRDFGYDIEVVRLAYEITINAIHEPSVNYVNSILERWNADGRKTLADIQNALAEEQAKKEGKKADASTLGNSFDTDDFFEAALRRSFADTNEGS